VILKDIKSYDRYRKQVNYLNGEDETAAAPSSSLYANDDRERFLHFNLLHRR
jgi:hypothetical protein